MCTGSEIALVGGVLQGGGQIFSGFQALKQTSSIASQIRDTAQKSLKDTARAQKSRRGAMRAAYAKAGITQKGTPKMALDEQIFQDELRLSAIEMEAVRNIKKSYRAGRGAFLKNTIGGVSSIGGSFTGFSK